MTPDEQEALSHKYSGDVWHVLRLDSGNYALFDESRQLRLIGSWEELGEAFAAKPPYVKREDPVHPLAVDVEINLDELGF